jgi:flagellar export protein FliJ
MKRFKFSLSGLEKVRQAKVDQARLTLARSEAARKAEEGEIMRLEGEMEGTAAAAIRDGVLDMTSVLEEQAYQTELRRKRDATRERLQQWIASVEEDRQRLMRARKEHKALERLRERRYLEFVQEVLHQENEATDEAGSNANWRNRKEA